MTPRIIECANVPGIYSDVTPAGSEALDALRLRMVDAGLFGSSVEQVQRETIRRLVSELRGEQLRPSVW